MSLLDLLTLSNLFQWLGVFGIAGILEMLVDKAIAVYDWGERISERMLWLTALAGGFWGIILGGYFFHHKASKPEFWVPIGIASILWIALLGSVVLGIV